ncbi:MAG: DNA repair protein RecN [Rikenellaceae bacterium]
MINKLHIENYLLIDNLDIEFNEGLNIITGETGAGKSILLGAISMLLGAKVEQRGSRKSDKNSVIEGVFSIKKYHLEEFFAENDLEYDHNTTISRVIMPSGKSRAYINDLPVTMTSLKDLGVRLVDVHSQHQTLLLLQEDFQMNVIDSVAGNGSVLSKYNHCFSELKRLHLRLSKLQDESTKNVADEQYVKFQYDELESASLKIGELELIEQSYLTLSNSAQIKEAFFNTNETLNGADGSIIASLKSITSSLDKVSSVSKKAMELGERLTSIIYDLKDIDMEADRYLDRIDDDPQKLEELEQRISILNKLLLKHNVRTEKELIVLREEYETRLLNIDLSVTHIEQCKKEIVELTAKAGEICSELSANRKAVAEKIEQYVVEQLHQLGMDSCSFKIVLEESVEFMPNGKDNVVFMFSANKGLAMEPIEKVASGGEMSRVMLSLKSLTAAYKLLPTIIFDEIDTGVSGRVADKMGEIMQHLSKSLQTICITHLPQVAAKGESHFLVSKFESADTTTTTINKLTHDQRVEVIAKMLSGSIITDAAREQAKLLIG